MFFLVLYTLEVKWKLFKWLLLFKYVENNSIKVETIYCTTLIDSIQLIMGVSYPWCWNFIHMSHSMTCLHQATYMFYLKLTAMLLNKSLLQGCITIRRHKISTPRVKNIVHLVLYTLEVEWKLFKWLLLFKYVARK